MITSILRTIVPALWGSIIAWVLSIVPALEPLREQLLSLGDLAAPIIGAVIIAAWYAFWRWLEPRLPDWLTRSVLGSAKEPSYEPLAVLASQVYDVNLTDTYHSADRPKHSADPNLTDDWHPATPEL